jgi:hypothetical protein
MPRWSCTIICSPTPTQTVFSVLYLNIHLCVDHRCCCNLEKISTSRNVENQCVVDYSPAHVEQQDILGCCNMQPADHSPLQPTDLAHYYYCFCSISQIKICTLLHWCCCTKNIPRGMWQRIVASLLGMMNLDVVKIVFSAIINPPMQLKLTGSSNRIFSDSCMRAHSFVLKPIIPWSPSLQLHLFAGHWINEWPATERSIYKMGFDSSTHELHLYYMVML